MELSGHKKYDTFKKYVGYPWMSMLMILPRARIYEEILNRPFLYSLGVRPFILKKKRPKVVESA